MNQSMIFLALYSILRREVVKIEKHVTYKFWFTLDVPIHDGMDEEMQELFEKVAAKIQEVCPFDDDNWDFSNGVTL